jgi:hypothetical protein
LIIISSITAFGLNSSSNYPIETRVPILGIELFVGNDKFRDILTRASTPNFDFTCLLRSSLTLANLTISIVCFDPTIGNLVVLSFPPTEISPKIVFYTSKTPIVPLCASPLNRQAPLWPQLALASPMQQLI